ncbi:dipeptidyl-peptidase 3 family protein [Duncaniella muricolitica]|jgi:dipeptidyl-peptidase-3|uniref:dipeptidyl-peptidase 3 family protein n=1 Tax=Duncaniella muricolitica TaxID=2880704 RepID=UPI003CC7240C
MLSKKLIIPAMASLAIMSSCSQGNNKPTPADFDYTADRFADIEVLRYQVPGFEELTPQQRIFIYYLTEAAIAGRDMLWDQNGKYNLAIRDLIEGVYTNYKGDRNDSDFKALETYLKQIEFANGIHHHYSMDKFKPGFSQEWLASQAAALPEGTVTDIELLMPVIFDPTVMPKRVNQAEGQDLILTSANNLYDGVNQAEVEAYYNALKDTTDLTPVSWGLNARVVKENGKVAEQIYKVGGLYSPALERIVENLEKALPYAENDAQKDIVTKLITYFRSGDLKDFDTYSIAWAEDTKSRIDFINGFIEDYGDPLGMTGAYESIVNFKNNEASHRTEIIADNAAWFEGNSPVDPRFRKDEVKGVSAKVITAAILAGDAYPATPIGINLPNSNWIRAAHGSKSVTLENITEAYDQASHGNGFNEEFVIDQETADLMDKYLFITDNLHTDLHECLGHASGRLLPGVDPGALKAHGSTLEEARADLFALYYLADPKLIELGLLDNPEAYKAEYYKYILNGLMTQLTRVEPGKDIEEAHMRNRQLISKWVFEKGQPDNVIELVKRDGKTYIKINDYTKMRELIGQLLAEVQRIKSEGDYAAGAKLVETYAVKVDPELHKEVLDRYAKLDIAPYRGFVNPVYTPVTDKDGNITDVTITYGEDYLPQVLRYSRDYRTLPAYATGK